jgi:exodeoxyribonuclease VII small subunit
MSDTKKINETVAEMPFEMALARLEEIVRRLERDTEPVSLDESLRLYEEGVALVRRCAGELNAAEQKVQVLRREADGAIKPTEFATTED